MATLERAIELAARHHAGQVDKAGQPYILHPLRVMFGVKTLDQRMVAVMHDIVEDTPITLDDLRAEGFSPAVVGAVEALTKQKGEERLHAAKRAAANDIARAVKLSDVRDNMDLSRIPNPTERDRERLGEYAKVLELLQAAEAATKEAR